MVQWYGYYGGNGYTLNGQGSKLRYSWRLGSLLRKSQDSILHVVGADNLVSPSSSIATGSRAVVLILTRQSLLVLDLVEDETEDANGEDSPPPRMVVYPLKDLAVAANHPSEPMSMLRLVCTTSNKSSVKLAVGAPGQAPSPAATTSHHHHHDLVSPEHHHQQEDVARGANVSITLFLHFIMIMVTISDMKDELKKLVTFFSFIG